MLAASSSTIKLSDRPKALIVGSFIMGAFALGVIAILALGGMSLFAHKLRVVAVFSESIAGLEVGAPVTFHGARIGRVGGMRLHIDVHHQASWIPVYLDLDLDRVSWAEGSVGGKRADLQAAVNAGLRAQLVSQGLVSGETSVNLDYRPDAPARLADRPEDAFEIPTVPSDLQDLKDQLLNLDLPKIGLKAQEVLVEIQHVTGELGARIGPLADGMQTTLATTTDAVHRLQMDSSRTLADVDLLAKESRRQVEINGNDLDQLLRLADQATGRADTLVASLNDMSSPRGDLQASLRDLAASASSLRGLTHDLQHDPLGTLLRRDN
jgi:paraquat-inducible protein B